MNVLLMLNGIDGVNYHRLAAPYMRLARQGKIKLLVEVNLPYAVKKEEEKKYADHLKTEVFDLEDGKKVEGSERNQIDPIHTFPDELLDEVDICVFNRNISPTLKPEFVFQRLRKHGIKIVCDMDDSPKVDSKHVLRAVFNKMNMTNCILFNALSSDAISVTTPQLKKEIQNFLKVPKKYIIAKNAIDYDDPQWEKYEKPQNDSITFGWMGSVTHYEDLKIFSEGYKLSQQPKLLIGGATRGDRVWDKVWDLFDGCDKIEFQGHKTVDEYAKLLYPYDVMVAPLKDNRFNRNKSELKMLEAAALRKPIIVSDVYPYKNLIDKNKNCLAVGNNAEEWANAIDRLVNEPQYGEYLATNLRADVDNRYNLDNENEKRLKLLQELI